MTGSQIGVLLNSALYLTGVFVAGLVLSDTVAWTLALTTAGVCYLAYSVQALAEVGGPDNENVSAALVILSILLGAASGIALLV